MSVRLATRASFDILVLIHACLPDARSWINGLLSDLRWMKLCDSDASFSISDWFTFCRLTPKKARLLIRRICESPAARSVTLSEQSTAVKSLQASYSCPCGWIGTSKAALCAHRGSAHLDINPAQFYAENNQCLACLVTFGSRGNLITHLTRGSGLCFLNIVLKVPPLPRSVVDAIREKEAHISHDKVNAGLGKHYAEAPPVRAYGPLLPLHSTQGDVVDTCDNRHPFGPRHRKYVRSCFAGCECDECVS